MNLREIYDPLERSTMVELIGVSEDLEIVRRRNHELEQ